MVLIKDEGSECEVPLEILREYLKDVEADSRAHPTVRKFDVKSLTDNAFQISSKQKLHGDWLKGSTRTLHTTVGLHRRPAGSRIDGTSIAVDVAAIRLAPGRTLRRPRSAAPGVRAAA